jgi:uncharacterized peroxidase-related enzyme
MTHRQFPTFDENTAPAAARESLVRTKQAFGAIPMPVARYASSPVTLKAALAGLDAFESTSLAPLERETVAMTVSRRNRCRFCLALHTRLLRAQGADPELIAALTEGGALPQPRLNAVARFANALLDQHGDVSQEVWTDLREAGYTHEQALEIALGVGVYTLTTLANRLTESGE